MLDGVMMADAAAYSICLWVCFCCVDFVVLLLLLPAIFQLAVLFSSILCCCHFANFHVNLLV